MPRAPQYLPLFSLWLLVLASLLMPGLTARQLPEIRIGVVVDGDWERNAETRELVKSEVLALTKGEFNVSFPDDAYLSGGWHLQGISDALDQLLSDDRIDMVLATGMIASQIACQRGPLPKPVIAPFVIDVILQDIPRRDGASGVKNLNYIAIPATFNRDLRAFQRIIDFKTVTLLFNGAFAEALPPSENRLREQIDELGIDYRIVIVKQLSDALSALGPETEAVYLFPLLNLNNADFQQLIQTFIKHKIPSFSLMGRNEVEQGVMAAMNPDIFPRVARRIGLNVQRILLGEDPGSIPYAFSPGESLVLNMSTASQIEVYPSWGVLTEATQLNDAAKKVERTLNLKSAVNEGVAVNLDFLARQKEVLAGRQQVRAARGNLLPQLDLSVSGVQIDDDRAGLLQAERTLSGSATLTQVLYSDGAWTNLAVETGLQRSLEAGRDALRLDIAQTIATSYLSLLSAKTFEAIQKENLRVSSTNLALARVRESIGFSGRAEVYRWESEIATNRKAVIEANANRNLVEIELNRLLHRPLEESFSTIEVDIQQHDLLAPDSRLLKFIENPFVFKTFRKFLVKEGLSNSPEIRQLEAGIRIQERILKQNTRSFFLPDLVAQAEFSRIFDRSGVGSEPVNDPTSPLAAFSTGDDNNWSVALSASLPLFEGGSKFARRAEAVETLQSLRIQRSSLAEKIEQRIRSAAHLAGASYAGIQQTGEAAEAARKNLELVTDAYSRGVLSIPQLIDAQTAARVADEAASNAIFNCFIDLVALERAAGAIHYLLGEDDLQSFYDRAETYFGQAGIKLSD